MGHRGKNGQAFLAGASGELPHGDRATCGWKAYLVSGSLFGLTHDTSAGFFAYRLWRVPSPAPDTVDHVMKRMPNFLDGQLRPCLNPLQWGSACAVESFVSVGSAYAADYRQERDTRAESCRLVEPFELKYTDKGGSQTDQGYGALQGQTMIPRDARDPRFAEVVFSFGERRWGSGAF